MDMTAALGTICLAEAVLDVFQQTVRTVILASNHRQHNLHECHHQFLKMRDPNWSINHRFIRCLLTLQLFTLRNESCNKKRWQGLRSNCGAQKQVLYTQAFSVRFWRGRWLPWVTSGWNQLYKLFKRPSLVFTRVCEASELPRCLALFLFMFFTSNFLFLLKLFRTCCRSGNVGHLRCYCQTSIAPGPPLHTHTHTHTHYILPPPSPFLHN